MLDKLPFAIFQISKQGLIISANQFATASFKFDSKSLVGIPFEKVFVGEELAEISKGISVLCTENKEFSDILGVIRRSEQEPMKIACSGKMIDDPQNTRSCLVFFQPLMLQSKTEEKLKDAIRDQLETEQRLRETLSELQVIHERLKSAQEQLVQSEKLRSVGHLAAGVAHEVKNPLAILLQGMEYLERSVAAKNPDLKDVILDMIEAIKRADSVVKQLLDFASPDDSEKSDEDIHEILDVCVNLVRHMIPANYIQIEKKYDKNIPRVPVDKRGLEQALVNLMTNAIYAMPDGGQLSIMTELCFKEGTDWIVIHLEDTGTGIPEDILKRIFEPFVTTRRGKGGTGLGLAVAKSIIEKQGGEIKIENRHGGGAHVTLYINVGK